MAKLGLQKPSKSQIINAGSTTVGAVTGFQAYEIVAQKLPITKMINLGILGTSIVGQAFLKGTGMLKTFVSAALLGITVNSGYTAAEDFGVIRAINKMVTPQIASAQELNGFYGTDTVDYIQEAEYVDSPMASLSGMGNQNMQLM